jgi:tRNA modification GTPase
MLATDSDPIVAIATAAGRGGIGVVRVSFGRGGEAAAQALSDALCGQRLAPRHASYVPFVDAHGAPLDRGIALYFPRRIRTPASMCSSCKVMAGRS